MKRAFLAFVGLFALVGLAVFLTSAAPNYFSTPRHPQTPPQWTGYNSQLSHYYVAPGYPPFSAHPRSLGH